MSNPEEVALRSEKNKVIACFIVEIKVDIDGIAANRTSIKKFYKGYIRI